MAGIEHFHRGVISGGSTGPGASLFRGMLRLAEPFYSVAVASRNAFFDRGIFASHRAGKPVISVGNITTGGTGKTPVVRWLAEALQQAGHKPAILTRGYKGGDEPRLLASQLPGVIVQANPSRIDGARTVLAEQLQVDLFILDDGFQHRRIQRDFDLVLIDATSPFGFGHVLPRGLLREPLSGLARASAFLITHSDLAQPGDLQSIESALKKYNPAAPIFHGSHVTTIPPEQAGKRLLAFCGIGNPAAFEQQIAARAELVAEERFDDHHAYSAADLTRLFKLAQEAGAEGLITTEKDWVKVEPLLDRFRDAPPIVVASLAIAFEPEHEALLLGQIAPMMLAQSKRQGAK